MDTFSKIWARYFFFWIYMIGVNEAKNKYLI